jgi:mycothiol maleylpyruvate isomerase-like protein
MILLLRTKGAGDFDPEHLLDVFEEQRQRFVTVLQGFGPGDWAAPTRCTDWSAQDVVRHLCDGNMKAAAMGSDDRTLDLTAGFDPRITPREWLTASAAYGLFIAAAAAAASGHPVQEKLTLGGDGGGGFDLDSRDGVTLTATPAIAGGPPAAQVTDALAGRPPAAAVLGDLPPGSRAALSRMANFFNTPAEPSPA